MKKILGLDLGTTSIGWAFIKEAENENKNSSVVNTGVRITQFDNFSKVDKTGKVTESKNPVSDFNSGNGLSPNAGRTLKRGARRSLQRFKQRRNALLEIFSKIKFIPTDFVYAETGAATTFSSYQLRANTIYSLKTP